MVVNDPDKVRAIVWKTVLVPAGPLTMFITGNKASKSFFVIAQEHLGFQVRKYDIFCF
jgi:hypothetical protein